MPELVRKWVQKLGKAYFSFGAGAIFGAIIATIVSATIFNLIGLEATNLLLIQECLSEKVK